MRHVREDVSFSPDGRRVVAYSAPVRVNRRVVAPARGQAWDAVTGRPFAVKAVDYEYFSKVQTLYPLPLSLQGQGVKRAWLSPDGRRVVGLNEDMTACVRDAVRGTALTPPLKYEGRMNCASFSRDGLLVVTGDDHAARVWDAARGAAVTRPFRHEGAVACASFSPDNRQVVTGSVDGTARLWNLSSDRRPFEELSLLSEVLSYQRIDATGGLVSLAPTEFRRAWERLKKKYPDALRSSR
jgi:WD40 repeat protein